MYLINGVSFLKSFRQPLANIAMVTVGFIIVKPL